MIDAISLKCCKAVACKSCANQKLKATKKVKVSFYGILPKKNESPTFFPKRINPKMFHFPMKGKKWGLFLFLSLKIGAKRVFLVEHLVIFLNITDVSMTPSLSLILSCCL